MRALIGWAALAMLVASPALADVKAGVDAWARGDYAAAVEQWRGSAIAGDADAQFNLGQAYKLGRGVPADLRQAEIWYAKAAAKGHAQAGDDYGLALFQDGRKADALPWLEKSAARDEKRSELVLGTMLFNGDGVAKDWVRAYALVSRSSQQGLSQGSTTLAQMDGYFSPEQRQQGIALATQIEDRAKLARTASVAGTSRARGASVPADSATDTPAPLATAPALAGQTHARVRPTPAASLTPPSPHPVTPIVKAPPRPAPAPHVATAAPHPAAAGRYRVQLGAFREPGAAQALWARVGARVGGQPSYSKAGAVTRLQAGPFASKADAERACHAAGVSCVVVPG